jgi:hypothetical protein
MTETVYIYNHWTTGWSFTKKIKYANQNPKMASGGSMKKKKKKKKREREFAPHEKKRERGRKCIY